jgi:hypothetical protein
MTAVGVTLGRLSWFRVFGGMMLKLLVGFCGFCVVLGLHDVVEQWVYWYAWEINKKKHV